MCYNDFFFKLRIGDGLAICPSEPSRISGVILTRDKQSVCVLYDPPFTQLLHSELP